MNNKKIYENLQEKYDLLRENKIIEFGDVGGDLIAHTDLPENEYFHETDYDGLTELLEDGYVVYAESISEDTEETYSMIAGPADDPDMETGLERENGYRIIYMRGGELEVCDSDLNTILTEMEHAQALYASEHKSNLIKEYRTRRPTDIKRPGHHKLNKRLKKTLKNLLR